MPDEVLLELLVTEVRNLRVDVQGLEIRLAVLENVRALAWKWGAGAAAAIATIVTVWHTIWSMIG